MKNMFKLGDKVVAKNDYYAHTNKKNNFIGEVVDIYDNYMSVKTISTNEKWCVGNRYSVNCNNFELLDKGVIHYEIY